METYIPGLCSVLVFSRCVRTIVVWKLSFYFPFVFSYFWLRKNHSGMETFVPGAVLGASAL